MMPGVCPGDLPQLGAAVAREAEQSPIEINSVRRRRIECRIALARERVRASIPIEHENQGSCEKDNERRRIKASADGRHDNIALSKTEKGRRPGVDDRE